MNSLYVNLLDNIKVNSLYICEFARQHKSSTGILSRGVFDDWLRAAHSVDCYCSPIHGHTQSLSSSSQIQGAPIGSEGTITRKACLFIPQDHLMANQTRDHHLRQLLEFSSGLIHLNE